MKLLQKKKLACIPQHRMSPPPETDFNTEKSPPSLLIVYKGSHQIKSDIWSRQYTLSDGWYLYYQWDLHVDILYRTMKVAPSVAR